MKLEDERIRGALKYSKEVLKAFMLGSVMCTLSTGGLGKPAAFAQQNTAEPQLEFRPIKGGSGRTAEGTRFSAQVYESSDGSTVSSRLDRFDSAQRARMELQRISRKGQVIEQDPKRNETGVRVGERVVVSFPASGKLDAHVVLLWTDKADLHRITGPSRRHVLDYEKQLYPYLPLMFQPRR